MFENAPGCGNLIERHPFRGGWVQPFGPDKQVISMQVHPKSQCLLVLLDIEPSNYPFTKSPVQQCRLITSLLVRRWEHTESTTIGHDRTAIDIGASPGTEPQNDSRHILLVARSCGRNHILRKCAFHVMGLDFSLSLVHALRHFREVQTRCDHIHADVVRNQSRSKLFRHVYHCRLA